MTNDPDRTAIGRGDPPVDHRRVLAIALPMILSALTIPLAGMVDTAVVGHLDEPRHLAAVAVASSLFAFLFMIFNFLRMGVTGLAAQCFGAGDEPGLNRVLWQGLTIGVSIGLALIVLQGPLAGIGLTLMGAAGEVSDEAARYFAVRVFGAPFLLMIYALTGWFVGVQRPRLVLGLLLVNNGLNIGLDLLFVPVLGMQAAGVAAATVLAEIGAFGFGIWLLVRQGLWRPPPVWSRLFLKGEARRLLHLNGDLFLRTLVLMTVFTFFTAQGARQGEEVLGANAVLLGMFVFAAYGLDGFAYAAEALVGQALGARDRCSLRRVLVLTAGWSAVQALLMALAFVLIGGWWIDWLTGIEEIRALARRFLPWVMVMPLVGFWAFWLDGVFVGATLSRDMRNTMLLSAAGFFVAWYLLRPLGNHGLWFAMMVFFALRGLLLGARLRQHSRTLAPEGASRERRT